MSKPILPNSYRASLSQIVGVEVKLTPDSVDACPEFVGIIEKVYFSQCSGEWVADCEILTKWYAPKAEKKYAYVRNPKQKVGLYLKDLRGLVSQKVLNV